MQGQAIELDRGKLIKLPHDNTNIRYLIDGQPSLPRSIVIGEGQVVESQKRVHATPYYTDAEGTVFTPEYLKEKADSYKEPFRSSTGRVDYPTLEDEFAVKKAIQELEESVTYHKGEADWEKPVDITDTFKVVGCVVDTGSNFITCNIATNRQTPNLFTIHTDNIKLAVMTKYSKMGLTTKHWDLSSVRFAKIGKDYINTDEEKNAYAGTLEDAHRIMKSTAVNCEKRIIEMITPNTLNNSQRSVVRKHFDHIRNRIESLNVKKSSESDKSFALLYIKREVFAELDEMELGMDIPPSIVEDILNEAS